MSTVAPPHVGRIGEAPGDEAHPTSAGLQHEPAVVIDARAQPLVNAVGRMEPDPAAGEAAEGSVAAAEPGWIGRDLLEQTEQGR